MRMQETFREEGLEIIRKEIPDTPWDFPPGTGGPQY